MTKEASITLYRYDSRQPPEDWDISFLSYEYDTIEHGHKNKAGLFFFTDSLEIANELGKCAAINNSQMEYFLTTTQTKNAKFIDFSNCQNIYHMLCLLADLGIDVLTEDFKTYEYENHFGQLKSHFEAAELETDIFKKANIIKNLTVHSKTDFHNISLFGQRLTDFDNGKFFKKIVTEKYSYIDGYVWREFNDNRGLTYCLFDSSRLTTKTTEKIKVD